MSKVMAVRQQQQTAPTGFEPGQSESPPTRWDLSAQSLLNMTRTFLRHVPEVCKKILSHLQKSLLKNLVFLHIISIFCQKKGHIIFT